MKSGRHIYSYNEFWFYFLDQHVHPVTRMLHATGTLIAVFLFLFGFLTTYYSLMILGILIGYAFGWMSHFFVEKNKPTSFRHPVWSFISELRLAWWVLSRRF